MASNRSLGSATLYINANAAGLLQEFNKADRQVARWSQGWTKTGSKVAFGFLGIQNAVSAVTNEIRHVISNIENIPGVPAETAASIITMRDNLASAKNWIDQMTASMVGFAAQAGQAVGVGAAMLMGYEDTSALSRAETPDEIARAKDPRFLDKLAAAEARLKDAKKATALASQDEVQQILTLRKEAQALETFSKSNAKNSIERIEAQIDAQEQLVKANSKMVSLQKELAESQTAARNAMTGAHVSTVSRGEAIAGLENRSQRIFSDMAATSQDPNDPAAVQKLIELNKELAGVQGQLGSLYEKNAQASRAFADSVVSGLMDGAFAGEKFSDTLRGIAVEIAKTITKQLILNAVMGMMGGGGGVGGFLGNLIGGFFADGGRPPVGRPSVVGERGPELFVPDMAGTIVPNHQLRSTSAPAQEGGTFVFSPQIAAGVTRQDLAGMMPRMFEQFSAMIADKAARGGGFRRSFA